MIGCSSAQYSNPCNSAARYRYRPRSLHPTHRHRAASQDDIDCAITASISRRANADRHASAGSPGAVALAGTPLSRRLRVEAERRGRNRRIEISGCRWCAPAGAAVAKFWPWILPQPGPKVPSSRKLSLLAASRDRPACAGRTSTRAAVASDSACAVHLRTVRSSSAECRPKAGPPAPSGASDGVDRMP